VKLKHLDALHTSSSFDNIQVQAKKECKNFVYEMFPDAKIEESFGDRIVCSIPQDNVSSLAQCFEKLERGEFVRVACMRTYAGMLSRLTRMHAKIQILSQFSLPFQSKQT
jgi:hypothetical protein